MKLKSKINQTTNYNYEVTYAVSDNKKNSGEQTINWSVSLTTYEEKRAFLLLAESALSQLKSDNFSKSVERVHHATNVWLKCSVPDNYHRKAMIMCLEKISSDIISEINKTK